MQPTTSNNDSQPVFHYPVQNQADFDNPFNNGEEALFTCAFRKWASLFKYLQEFKLPYQ